MRLSTLQFDSASLKSLQLSQQRLQEVQTKLVTGKKYLNINEAPVETSRLKNLEVFGQQLETLTNNNKIALNNLQLSEQTLTSMSSVIQRIQELKIQASVPSYTQANRNVVATEMEERLNELLALANTRNTNGEYIYSGYSANTQAFIKDSTNNFVYQGDTGRRYLDVGISATISLNDPGFDLFENIPTGNGTFQVSGNPANTGSGTIAGGEVVNASAYVNETYTINFVNNASGELAYTVTGSTSGQLIPALPLVIPNDAPAYSDNATINFNGINIAIRGEPDVGDNFTVEPSTTQNIFTSVQNMINALRQGVSNDADYARFMNAFDANSLSLTQGFNRIVDGISDIGTRINVVDSETAILGDFSLQNSITLSEFGDYDAIEGSILFSQLTTQLEASQQIFVKLSQLSLLSIINR
ncbi:MAG: flagellar hook-associated protein FlgL [Legionellales bacterium]|nr:flagellar hook-associated protein FlgL [Legionellales bacterium]